MPAASSVFRLPGQAPRGSGQPAEFGKLEQTNRAQLPGEIRPSNQHVTREENGERVRLRGKKADDGRVPRDDAFVQSGERKFFENGPEYGFNLFRDRPESAGNKQERPHAPACAQSLRHRGSTHAAGGTHSGRCPVPCPKPEAAASGVDQPWRKTVLKGSTSLACPKHPLY